MSKWIPVKAKKPQLGETVLISCEYEGTKWLTMGYLAEYPDYDSPEEDATYTQWELEKQIFLADNDSCVKAWMPLPNYYTESEENENAESN